MHTIRFPSRQQTQLIDGPSGKLQIIASPADAAQAMAIICHPHPQHGGTMHNKVVTTVHKAFQQANMHTVRFNYRGVGQSEGCYDQGNGEAADLVAVLEWMNQNFPTLPLYLAGFSFGSYIAYRIAGMLAYKHRVHCLLSIAPPVQYPEFHSLPAPICPWLVIQGDADEIVDADEVYRWLQKSANPVQLVRMANTGHFFDGKLIELKKLLLENLI